MSWVCSRLEGQTALPDDDDELTQSGADMEDGKAEPAPLKSATMLPSSMMACRREPSRIRASIFGLLLSIRRPPVRATRLTKLIISRAVRNCAAVFSLPRSA